jgi:hypothetical protein
MVVAHLERSAKMKTSIPSLVEARKILFASDPMKEPAFEVLAAADVLMRASESSEKGIVDVLLRCLEFRGVVAECGARGLYVRTGRDGVGWKPALSEGLPFSTSKEDWLDYLRASSHMTE